MNEPIILIQIQYILLMIADIVLYICLIGAVYPWFTMRVTLIKDRTPALRGIRRVVFPEGRGVVYLPDVETRRYIKDYAVFEKDGRRFVLCRIDPHISVIRYDIASFDFRGRLLDIQSVNERIKQKGLTSSVALPAKTAYSQVFVRRVDAMPVKAVAPFGYSKLGIALFAVLTTVTTVVASLIFYDAFSRLILDIGLINDIPAKTPMVVLISLINGAVTSGLTLLCYRHHLTRRINR